MKRWYAVQVYSGYEQAAKDDIERRIHESGMEEFFGDILVPATKGRDLSAGRMKVSEEQLFPGYLFIEMDATPLAMKLVLASTRVSKFLGGATPEPLSEREVARIGSQLKGEIPVESRKEIFFPGHEVEIAEGPFAGFMGIISTVDDEHEKLVVMVSIFGRMTPVELGFHQVK
jgi:transcriptional antiterminator NusG